MGASSRSGTFSPMSKRKSTGFLFDPVIKRFRDSRGRFVKKSRAVHSKKAYGQYKLYISSLPQDKVKELYKRKPKRKQKRIRREIRKIRRHYERIQVNKKQWNITGIADYSISEQSNIILDLIDKFRPFSFRFYYSVEQSIDYPAGVASTTIIHWKTVGDSLQKIQQFLKRLDGSLIQFWYSI